MIRKLSLEKICVKFSCDYTQLAGLHEKRLANFKMETEDAKILKEIYRWTNPKRFLEIGTWKGFGSRLVLQSSQATVWSINLLEGEKDAAGRSLYEEKSGQKSSVLDRLFGKNARTLRATDSGVEVGSLVHEAGLGHRFNQIFCAAVKFLLDLDKTDAWKALRELTACPGLNICNRGRKEESYFRVRRWLPSM